MYSLTIAVGVLQLSLADGDTSRGRSPWPVSSPTTIAKETNQVIYEKTYVHQQYGFPRAGCFYTWYG